MNFKRCVVRLSALAVLSLSGVVAQAVPIPVSGAGVQDATDEISVRTRRGDGLQHNVAGLFQSAFSGNLLVDFYIAIRRTTEINYSYFDVNESVIDTMFDPPAFGYAATNLLSNTDYHLKVVFAYQGDGIVDVSNFRLTSIGNGLIGPAPLTAPALTDPLVIGSPHGVPEPGTLGLLALGLAGAGFARRRKR